MPRTRWVGVWDVWDKGGQCKSNTPAGELGSKNENTPALACNGDLLPEEVRVWAYGDAHWLLWHFSSVGAVVGAEVGVDCRLRECLKFN